MVAAATHNNPWHDKTAAWQTVYNVLYNFDKSGGIFRRLDSNLDPESLGPQRNCFSYALGLKYVDGNKSLTVGDFQNLTATSSTNSHAAIADYSGKDGFKNHIENTLADGLKENINPSEMADHFPVVCLYSKSGGFHFLVPHKDESNTQELQVNFSCIMGFKNEKQPDGGWFVDWDQNYIHEIFQTYGNEKPLTDTEYTQPKVFFVPKSFLDATVTKEANDAAQTAQIFMTCAGDITKHPSESMLKNAPQSSLA